MRKKFWIMIVIWIGTFMLSCCVGRYDLSMTDIGQILLGWCDDAMKCNVFWRIRLSRTFLVAVSGGALALAGFVYQSMFQNPLVSPDVLGVSSGCSVGAITALLFFGGSAVISQALSFAAGLAVVALSVALAQAMGGRKLYSLILAGIILGALSNAVIMTLKYGADPSRQLAAIEYWLMGSFHTANWSDGIVAGLLSLGAFLLLFLLRWQLKLLILGGEEAFALGVRVLPVRLGGILGATVLTAAVVSVAGVVSWIGLIVPHMVRMIFGERFEDNFIQSVFCGSILLMIADTLARSIFTAEIPISILTSLIGAIFLVVFLLTRRKEGRWSDGD
ncbi:iron ABC transporter permease [Anaerotignum lactatifermentans]|uniref:Iron ABC transporter permease n=1 Tax=Anaerotignum lactatifermentans TaxID=160404 RepID=A0ABS2GAH9_9FIRM|nr:iron ABC transporter permease [Anaerotignum lactatifermentans]MBM6829430.1 iron ABC transporter permease [Anaerotignum lactatifermentans]MBM6877788.1 iron ABC transporter permease [Anaerotignum lactatifermentans]MBM6951007.1 iron ABC transporter permease [Anaerotignum lactatifermentans]